MDALIDDGPPSQAKLNSSAMSRLDNTADLGFEDFVDALRRVEGLRDRGKNFPNFHYKSKPFLHFHDGPNGPFADVRFGDEFEPWPLATPTDRRALLQAVRDHIAATAASRRP